MRYAATVMLGVATSLSALSAFEGVKWRGLQSAAASQSTSLGVVSARFATKADEQTVANVVIFIAWAQAVAKELSPEDLKTGGYTPKAGAHSRFLYERLPKEFRPAMAAWLAKRPFQNKDAPATPFEMPEYRLVAAKRAAHFHDQAEARSADAATARLRADSYAAIPILFSMVLFLTGIANQSQDGRVKTSLLAMAFALMLAGGVALAAVAMA